MLLDLQPLRLDRLLHDVGVILSATAEGENVALRFDVDPSVPGQVLADSLRLQQVLINLVGNAIKFTERGAVCVQWRVAAWADDGQAVTLDFAVVDTGIGIAQDHQASCSLPCPSAP